MPFSTATPPTSTDADLIASQGVPVVQIATVNGCHLDANLVSKALASDRPGSDRADLRREHRQPDLPGGISARLQGARGCGQRDRRADMVKKHPHMFLGAQIVVINKTDLAAAMEVSVAEIARETFTL